MIISHKLKIIFIHIPKNAGTYITSKMKNIDPSIVDTHVRAKEIKDSLLLYPDYRVFTVLRNPYSRCVSFYAYIQQTELHYLHEKIKNKTFKEFLEYSLNFNNPIENQYNFIYDDDGTLLINNILSQENLDAELNLFFKDVPQWANSRVKYTQINASQHDFYKNYYDEKSIEMVKKICDKDIEHFGFTF